MPSKAEGTTYLIKLHAYNQEHLFGSVQRGSVCLNDIGHIAADEWVQSSRNRQEIELDGWAILPNYIQGIVVVQPKIAIREAAGYDQIRQVQKPRSLSAFVAGFKAAAAKRINLLRNNPGLPVWERSYRERLLYTPAQLDYTRQSLQEYPL
ncbi:MAG: hypothetical protein AAF215_06365 [Cyanobacteria bacterium P01_A01_bin.123]